MTREDLEAETSSIRQQIGDLSAKNPEIPTERQSLRDHMQMGVTPETQALWDLLERRRALVEAAQAVLHS
jgi:hypothetical protein